ncbi:MAG: hypothetical protein D6702_01545 [Planctomycetota bacterium]|nr:MAG: hypothetical protein D6702_01545 [Planctomycetota bacterium]
MWAVLAALILAGCVGAQEPPHRPDILVVLSDDLGAGDPGFRGGPAHTPNLDRLAAEGLQLDRFYVQPLCTPTRAALMTGRWPIRFGLQYRPLRPWDTRGLPAEVPILPEVLHSAGYRTAVIGKWHLGHGDPGQHPNRRGVDHFYGLLTGAVDYWSHRRGDAPDWQRNGVTVQEEGYATDLLAAEAERWIAAATAPPPDGGERPPFFLLLAFNAPHTPLQAPPADEAAHADEKDPARRAYLGMVDAMDRALGRVLAALERAGAADHTLVLFLNDNGGARREGARNGGRRGGKGTCFEGGIRVPAIVRWPGVTPAGGHDPEPAAVIDLLPTLAAAAGAALPADWSDGVDLRARWRQPPAAGSLPPRPLFFGALDERFLSTAVVLGDHKLVRRVPLAVDAEGVGRPRGPAEEWLLDLAADPHERTNLAPAAAADPALAAVRDRLAAELERFAALDVGPPPEIRSAPPPGWEPPRDWGDASRPPAARPDLVLIVADDLGWGDVGFHGGPATPAIDRIAAEGVRFENFQAMALCTPTRAALLTGVDPMELGLASSPLRPWDEDGLPPGVPTLAERLRAAGYATACIGKWHLGHARPEQHPNARGFDRFYGCLNGYVDYRSHRSRDGAHDWQRDGEPVVVRGYATRLLAAEAERWIRNRPSEQPLFLYLPFTAPHLPLQAPGATLERFAAEADPDRRAYLAMVAELDDAVGRVLAALEETGRLEKALVLFLSDNGNARDEPGVNGPFRGGKGSPFEGALRVPAALRWPGHAVAGAVAAERRSVLDVAPTLLAAAGMAPAPPLPGHDLLAGLPPPRILFSAAHTQDWRNYAAVRWPWKYVRRQALDGSVERHLLFDLAADPGEQHDRAADEPDILAELSAAVDAWRRRAPAGGGSADAGDRGPSPPPGWTPPADWAAGG